nr:hypothetical protein CFP56_73326 [Quercus suber]
MVLEVGSHSGAESHGAAGAESHGVASDVGVSVQTEVGKSDGRNSNQTLAVMTASGSEAKSKFSLSSEQNSPDRWDVPTVTSRDGEESMETRFRRNETEAGLVKELLSEKEIAMSTVNISTSGLGKEEVMVSAPINFKMQVDSIGQTMGLSPNINKKATGRGRIKRMAREKNMAQEENVMSPRSGKKRLGNFEELTEGEGRGQKRIQFTDEDCPKPSPMPEIVVTDIFPGL